MKNTNMFKLSLLLIFLYNKHITSAVAFNTSEIELNDRKTIQIHNTKEVIESEKKTDKLLCELYENLDQDTVDKIDTLFIRILEEYTSFAKTFTKIINRLEEFFLFITNNVNDLVKFKARCIQLNIKQQPNNTNLQANMHTNQRFTDEEDENNKEADLITLYKSYNFLKKKNRLYILNLTLFLNILLHRSPEIDLFHINSLLGQTNLRIMVNKQYYEKIDSTLTIKHLEESISQNNPENSHGTLLDRIVMQIGQQNYCLMEIKDAIENLLEFYTKNKLEILNFHAEDEIRLTNYFLNCLYIKTNNNSYISLFDEYKIEFDTKDIDKNIRVETLIQLLLEKMFQD